MMRRNEPQDIVDVERNSNIMRWTKRTAALLASLLLLSTVVQAREPAKAHAREILGVSPSETEEMPELIVVAPETAAPEMPELTVAAPRPAEGPEAPRYFVSEGTVLERWSYAPEGCRKAAGETEFRE